MSVQRTMLAVAGSVVLGVTMGSVAFAQNPIGGAGGGGGAGGSGGGAGASTVTNSNVITCGDDCKAPTKATASVRGTSNGGRGGGGGHGGHGGPGINRF
jgi:hypothetical protein